jgi:N6-adenosine-specific RNA methylase IME4
MYSIVYADPPWDYNGREQHNTAEANKSASDHYNTATLEDLKKIKVASVCAKDCLLFMWTSSPHLEQALELMKAWGFQYKTIAFVWHKQKTNPGYYTVSSVEICLVGKKGIIPSPRGARNIRQFLSEERTEHSKKPDEIRNRIVQMFPTQKKLELFARQRTEGWDVFGNEVEGSIKL